MFTDYHVHAIGHEHRLHNEENIMKYIEFARINKVKEIGFADHCRYLYEKLDLNLYKKVQEKVSDISIKVGLEIDYYPDKIQEIEKKVNFFDYDYIIGSVHYIGKWMFDSDKEKQEYQNWDHDKLYEKYISLVTESARKDFYDILGHIDLIKIFGIKPVKRRPENIFAPYLKEISKTGLVVEINTNGLNKPVKEIYPSFPIIQMLFDNNIPVTLSSDAHHPEEVGRELDKARELALKAGYRKKPVFTKRRLSYEHL